MLTIRDFIYLDAERLKSILSQIDRGLLETMQETAQREKTLALTGGASLLKFLSAGGSASFLWQKQQTETRTLHDHIYNLVEEALATHEMLIQIPGSIRESDVADRGFEDMLSETSFVLVTGQANINHYKYMQKLLQNFNDIARCFARSRASSEIAKHTSVQVRKRALKEAEEKASLDPELVTALQLMLDTFYRDRISFKMIPFEREPDFRLVGPLHSQFLREDIDTVIYKYGTAPVTRWHMLAQIASIPKSDRSNVGLMMTGAQMEIAWQQVFGAVRDLEEIALSVVYPEIAVTPIAVYRE